MLRKVSSFVRAKGEGRFGIEIKESDKPLPYSSSRSSKTQPSSNISISTQLAHPATQGEMRFLQQKSSEELDIYLTHADDSKFQSQSDEIQELRAHNIRLQQTCISQNDRISDLTQGLEQNQRDLQVLRTQLANTREELSSCKDDIFRMQPVPQIPDTEVTRAFEQVCENVASWVDAELLLFEGAHPDSQPGQLFCGGSSHLYCANFLQGCPNFGEYLVTYEIHRLLQKSILNSNSYLFGLNQEVTELFKFLESSMSNAKPAKGITLHSFLSISWVIL